MSPDPLPAPLFPQVDMAPTSGAGLDSAPATGDEHTNLLRQILAGVDRQKVAEAPL